MRSDRSRRLSDPSTWLTCRPMADGVTRRQLFVIAEAGAATAATAAFSGCAVLRGGRHTHLASNEQRMNGTLLRFPWRRCLG